MSRPDVIEKNKSLEQRKKVSDSWKDPIIREKRMSKLRGATWGFKKGEPSKWRGSKHSKESIEKMRQSHKGQKAWNKGLHKDDPRVKKYTSNSAKTRKEKGSQRGEKHFWFGKKRPDAAKKIIETMQSGKMKRVFNTKPELKMKSILNDWGIVFEFQKNIKGYMVDFYIPKFNAIIEVDGEYWHNFPFGREKDRARDEILSGFGYRVIRFWANDVLKDNIYFPFS
jgi:very-short-patch-repair endonuclease